MLNSILNSVLNRYQHHNGLISVIYLTAEDFNNFIFNDDFNGFTSEFSSFISEISSFIALDINKYLFE
jgi:hypothetical protein